MTQTPRARTADEHVDLVEQVLFDRCHERATGEQPLAHPLERISATRCHGVDVDAG